ncbi:hypothetical protein BH24ACI5_BH24ACI5_17540 [soil metagenome]
MNGSTRRPGGNGDKNGEETRLRLRRHLARIDVISDAADAADAAAGTGPDGAGLRPALQTGRIPKDKKPSFCNCLSLESLPGSTAPGAERQARSLAARGGVFSSGSGILRAPVGVLHFRRTVLRQCASAILADSRTDTTRSRRRPAADAAAGTGPDGRRPSAGAGAGKNPQIQAALLLQLLVFEILPAPPRQARPVRPALLRPASGS